MAYVDQNEAFEAFKQRVIEGIRGHFPIQGRLKTLEVVGLDSPESPDPDDLRAQYKAKMGGSSWSVPLYATLALRDNQTGKVVEQRKVRVADLPGMTRRYSHIVDGQEYQVDNQWQLKPGVYTKRRQTGELETRFNVPNKQSFDVTFDPESKLFMMDRGKSKAIPVYPLMKSLGIDDAALEQQWGKDILIANQKARAGGSALLKFFKADRKNAATSPEEAERYFLETMRQSTLRPDSTEITLGKGFTNITGDTFVRATAKMLRVHRGQPEDDRDSLVFKDLRSVGDYAFDKLDNYKTRAAVRNKVLRRLDRATTVRDVLKYDMFNEPVKKLFSGSDSTSRRAAQINPVGMLAAARQTTIMGPGGIQSEQGVMEETKLINASHIGFLDPIHTPEGEHTGVSLHLPIAVQKRGNEPTIPLYNLATNKIEYVPPRVFVSSNVVLPDQVTWRGGHPVPISEKVKMAGQGNEITEGNFHQAQYVMRHPSQMFDVVSNLIPFMGNTSGNRASYATQHIEQAISLLHREAPLVQVGTSNSAEGARSYEELLGRHTSHTAPFDGRVVAVRRDGIMLESNQGQRHEVQLYNNFPLNDPKAVLDSTSLVKTGDHVKAHQAIADTNFTRNGVLALGRNLEVAYLPFRGYNFEDGVVVSKSASEKLSSVHMHKPEVKRDSLVVTNPKKFATQHPEAFTTAQYKLLDEDGLVKPGILVKTGDPLALGTKPYQLRDKLGIRAIRKSISGAHTDVSLRWESDHPGEVVGVHTGADGTVTVHVKTVEPLQIGDKLAGRSGNKGIATLILPDAEMPHTKEGKALDVLLNPLSVPGRMNLGQVLETAASKIARKTGEPYIVENFGHTEDMLQKVQADLKKHGLHDTEELIDPKTGLSLGHVLTGPQHIIKLTHQIDKKTSARGGMDIAGMPKETYDLTLMPQGGGKTGAQSIGNLGIYTLLAHGSKAIIREGQTWKSEGSDPSPEGKRWPSQHDEVWQALQTGDPLPTPKPTFAWQKFTDMLRAAGVNVEKKGHKIQLSPLTNSQILAMSNGELKDPSALTYSTLDENGEPKPRKGGLFDPHITGGHGGKRWSHFGLVEPMPNPVFEGAIQKVLGMTEKQYTSLVESDHAIDSKSHATVPLGTAGSLTGGPAIAHMLAKIDVKKDLASAKKELDAAKIPANFAQGKGTQKLDRALKRVKYLQALDTMGVSADDAYVLKNIPVIPPAMRPASVLPNGAIRWADLNGLYKNIASLNGEMRNPNFQTYLSDADKKEHRAALYDGLKALMGIGMSYESRKGEEKGLLLQIGGSQPKRGYFQHTLLSRRQDMTMRSTIVPEPSMGLDQVGLPAGKALTLFRPFVIKKMVDHGVAKHPIEAQQMLGKKEAEKDPHILKALDAVMEDRPVLLKRDPALHKHSIQAFNAFRVPGKAIQIHPLVTGGYNADFDGDQMSVYVPISHEAVQEARAMFPSNNLFNEATGKVMNIPTLESALGLYKLSRVNGEAKKTLTGPMETLRAVQAGKLRIDEPVHVTGMGTTTAGRILIASELPEVLQKKMLTDHSMVLDSKGLADLYTHIAKEHRGQFGEVANKLKDLGFGATFGVVRIPHPDNVGPNKIASAEKPLGSDFMAIGAHSLSLKDFEPDKVTRDLIVQQTQKKVDTIHRSNASAVVKDQLSSEQWRKATDQMTVEHRIKAEKTQDNLYQMLKAGTKPGINQYRQMKLAPMLMEDAAGRIIPTPVTRSYAEGLDVAGYWTQMHGARKGSVQKVQQVREPGAFSKDLINTTMSLVVNGNDCGTERGISLPVSSKELYDRELATDVTLGSRTFSRGTILTPDVVAQIHTADRNARVVVRSSLKCEHGKGLCQKCAGIAPSGIYYPLGTNVGVIAAQSLGERSVQLSLKSFHSGGTVGGGSRTLGLFGRIKQLTELPERIPDEATLAMSSGTIDKIEHDKLGSTVIIGGQAHFVPLDRAGRSLTHAVPGMPASDWKPPQVGQRVEAGRSLSDPERTFINPHDLYKATKNIEEVQNHIVKELHSLYSGDGYVRRQHLETVVKAMTDLTRVRDPGDAPGVLKGEFHSASQIRALNRQLIKDKQRPVDSSPVMKGINVMPLKVQEDWMAKLNHEQLRGSLIEAAATLGSSNLHSVHPIPGVAYGAEFGMTSKHKALHPHLADVPVWNY